MRKIIVTGSAGLIGSESARHFAAEGYRVIGIDNDMRSQFFGPAIAINGAASVAGARKYFSEIGPPVCG